jgi:hypothetical protein
MAQKKGYKPTKETLKKISESNKGKHNYWFGKKHSEETKEKIRQSKLGKKRKPFSEEWKIKLGEHSLGNEYGKALKGIKRSEETKKKISLSKIGELNPNWNNGKTKTSGGYIMLRKLGHSYSENGYVMEHRLVMEEFLGRYLLPEEVVHHKNEIKDDNRIENLMLFPNNGEHKKYHNKLKVIA